MHKNIWKQNHEIIVRLTGIGQTRLILIEISLKGVWLIEMALEIGNKICDVKKEPSLGWNNFFVQWKVISLSELGYLMLVDVKDSLFGLDALCYHGCWSKWTDTIQRCTVKN